MKYRLYVSLLYVLTIFWSEMKFRNILHADTFTVIANPLMHILCFNDVSYVIYIWNMEVYTASLYNRENLV